MRRYIKPAAFLFITAAIIFMTKHYSFGDNMINSLLELRELASSRPVTAALIYIIAASVGCVLLALPGAAAFTIGAAGIGEPEHRRLYFMLAAVIAVLVTLAGMILKKRFIK